MANITVHLICNAHIDPVWLWPWSAGLDEIINTCSSVCDLLDRNADVIFTRGEAWVYEQIEKIDPKLFARICRHIRRGQWEIVGGWYLQPDCNLPTADGLRQQIKLGRNYFRRRFGQFPAVAYNVDSFGHAAVLPSLMAEAGQRYYVMMRPQEHELALPARLFRWRGDPKGPEVLTFRIAGAYQTSRGLTPEHIAKSLTALPTGVTHTMCYVGVGDHGGGPTQELVEWCRSNRGSIPGATLEFSSPARFFRAVVRQAKHAPLVTGELQHHAIGCYSVHRAAKVGVRRTEHALAQAEEALRMRPALRARYAAALLNAWQWLCFNQFHDTLGGTCLPSTYAQMDAQLGLSQTVADEVLAMALRTAMVELPPSVHQRLIIGNYAAADFNDWLEHEPWLEWTVWQSDWGLVDEKGRAVPHQLLPVEAVFGESPRLLFKLALKRGELRVLRIVRGVKPSATVTSRAHTLKVHRGRSLRLTGPTFRWSVPELELVTDRSDTWSHGIDRYAGPVLASVNWGKPRRVESGPLLQAWCMNGKFGASRIAAEIRLYRDEPFIELRLRVTWLETHRVLRLRWLQPAEVVSREDGVSGGASHRPSDGAERPVHDRTVLKLKNGKTAGAVFPDTFSISGTARDLRLTLLRSAVMAHHTPHNGIKERRVISDQGVQNFVFRFYPQIDDPTLLDRHALYLHRRPGVADLTRGMPLRAYRGQVTAKTLS